MMSTEEKIMHLIADQLALRPEKVIPSASLVDDLGADSLDLVDLMLVMEDEVGRAISDEEARRIQTVQDAIDLAEPSLRAVVQQG